MARMQRKLSVVDRRWVHAGWNEAVIDSSGGVTAKTTAIEGAEVIQSGRPQVAVGQLALVGLICIDLGSAQLPKEQGE